MPIRFTSRFWYPAAMVGCLVNAVAAVVAINPADPLHASLHAGLAAGLGLWAQGLRARRRGRPGDETALSAGEAPELRAEIDDLRREMGELQERVDFTERLLTQMRDVERLPRRQDE